VDGADTGSGSPPNTNASANGSPNSYCRPDNIAVSINYAYRLARAHSSAVHNSDPPSSYPYAGNHSLRDIDFG